MINEIHVLWVSDKGEIPSLVNKCYKSFALRNIKVNIWLYENLKMENHENFVIRDANTILSKDLIFKYKNSPAGGSFAGFADMFRYHVLEQFGGL